MIRELTQLSAGIYQRLTALLGYAPDPYLPWFGDGADGDLVVSNGQTVIVTANKRYRNVTVQAGGTLVAGTDGTMGTPILRVAGTLRVTGTLRAGYWRHVHNGGYNTNTAGATTAGAAVNAYSQNGWSQFCWGGPGGSGAGGGSMAYVGGNGYNPPTTSPNYPPFDPNGVSGAARAGTTGTQPGPQNAYRQTLLYAPPVAGIYLWPGAHGCAGGGGSINITGTGNAGGYGGRPGRGGGILIVYARNIIVESTGIIHADGEAGVDGGAGAAMTGSGCAAGGGGGGAGAGGGCVDLHYHTITKSGTVRALGAAGGAAGLGKLRWDDAATATPWAQSTSYAPGTIRRPTVSNGYLYGCMATAAGNSGTVEPVWPTTPGQTVSDGAVSWVCIAQGTNQDAPCFSGGAGGAGSNGAVFEEVI